MGPLAISNTTVSAPFLELLEAHTTWGMGMLTSGLLDDTHHIFRSSEHLPWSESGYNNRLPRLLKQEMEVMGKEVKHIGSTMLRRIFTTGMRDDGSRGTEFEEGAAQLMGNSVKEWDRHVMLVLAHPAPALSKR